MTARSIIEVETPKGVFRQATGQDPGFEYVDRLLQKNRWQSFGGSPEYHGWMLKFDDYREDHTNPPRRVMHVWWDKDTKEWCWTLEGQKKHFGRWGGNHRIGFRTYKSGRELIDAIKQRHWLSEAEDPKDFLHRIAPQRTRGQVDIERVRSYVIGKVNEMPERTPDNLEQWYRQAEQVMGCIMQCLEVNFNKKAPEGMKELFKTWLNSDPVEAGNTMVDDFEQFVQEE